jgi:hypothetical protein
VSTVHVERLGGFAGLGLPGSRIRSQGSLAWSALPPAAQQQLDALFAGPPRPPPDPGTARDAFHYRLTRQGPAGLQTLHLSEADVPAELRDTLHDELI